MPVADVEAFFEKAAECFEAMVELKSEYTMWEIDKKGQEMMVDMVSRLAQNASQSAPGSISLTEYLGKAGDKGAK